MQKHFCTIITSDYMSYAQVLLQSLHRLGLDIVLNVLVVDDPTPPQSEFSNFNVYTLKDIDVSDVGQKIIRKYKKDAGSTLRWALKPVFISYLLKSQTDKVIYVDPDIAFFGSVDFLFNELDTAHVLLTPHWRNIDPEKGRSQFELVFKEGLYNAGFIGASKGCEPAMDWWAKVCLETCSKEEISGFYDDQAYLNAMPLYFDKVKVLAHKGCNVAAWNRKHCPRSIENGEVLIAGQYSVVFIHFTPSTIRDIDSGKDGELAPFLAVYKELLTANQINLPKPKKKGLLHKLKLK